MRENNKKSVEEAEVKWKANKDKLIELCNNNLTLKEIGDYFDVNYQTVAKYIKRFNIPRKDSRKDSERRRINLTSWIFGKLKVIKHIYGEKWECECSCPKKTIIQDFSCHLKSGHTKS